jgi:hypothetical protein
MDDLKMTAVAARLGNRAALEQVQRADHNAWATIGHCLGERDRELREERNER